MQRDRPKGSLPFFSPFPSLRCPYYVKALNRLSERLSYNLEAQQRYIRTSECGLLVGVAEMTLQSLQCNSKASRMRRNWTQ